MHDSCVYAIFGQCDRALRYVSLFTAKLIKRTYRNSLTSIPNFQDNDSLSDLVRTVEKSSKGNKAVIVDEIFQWQDWKSFFADEFCPIQGIRNYHYFRFSALNPGVVFVKEISADDERPLGLCRNPTADFSSSTLPLSSISQRYIIVSFLIQKKNM